MALLHMALAWGGADRFIVLTVDHGLRAEARAEAEQVGAHCAQLGLEHRILTWTPPGGHVSQARARDARHRLLASSVQARGGSHLLLGHTLDDQYETVMMRAARGEAGRAGMRALSVSPVWPEGRGIVLGRPLLTSRRDALRAFLLGKGVDWVEDPSNENRTFERVRVRQALGGFDKSEVAAEDEIVSIYQAAHAARVASDLRLAAWLDGHVEGQSDGLIVCDPAQLGVAEFAEGLTYLLLAASGSDRPAPLSGRLELARDILDDPKDWRSRTLGGGWLAPRRGRVHIARDPGAVPPLPDFAALGEGGGSIIWDGRFEIFSRKFDGLETGKAAEDIDVSALARAGFPLFENEHALLRCLVAERLGGVKEVLGHETCRFAC